MNKQKPSEYTDEEWIQICGARIGLKNNRYIPVNAGEKLIRAHQRNELRYRAEIDWLMLVCKVRQQQMILG